MLMTNAKGLFYGCCCVSFLICGFFIFQLNFVWFVKSRMMNGLQSVYVCLCVYSCVIANVFDVRINSVKRKTKRKKI